LTINEMAKRSQATSKAKGFVNDNVNIDQKLLLAVGELSSTTTHTNKQRLGCLRQLSLEL
jgi:hypothetical protein